MEFTTKLTESDYAAAIRLVRKSRMRTIASIVAYTLATVFWTFLIAAWVFARLHPGNDFLGKDPIQFQSTIFPGAAALLVWILVFRVCMPFNIRRNFRKAKNLHYEILNFLSTEGLLQKTSEGSHGFSRWGDYSHWKESEEVFVLMYPTKVFCLPPKSGLDLEQQSEVRAILSAALPKK